MNAALQDEEQFGRSTLAVIGKSAAMTQLRAWVEQVAPHSAPVLLLGETGTGKDVVARAIAQHSCRHNAPYVPINCGALAESLIESELFGHERGAFTGALSRKQGAFEAAHGGTLFLDEIGELPLALQTQLLRVLENGEVRRVGTNQPMHVRVRILAATNRNLADQVRAGTFRADLFHRLHVLVAELAPLRQRLEDIPALVVHFLRLDAPYRGAARLTDAAMAKIMAHSWPGNVRELRHVLQRAVLFSSHPWVDAAQITFAPSLGQPPSCPMGSSRPLQDIEREAILAELQRQRGNRKAAAEALGLSRSTLHRRLNDLGLAAD